MCEISEREVGEMEELCEEIQQIVTPLAELQNHLGCIETENLSPELQDEINRAWMMSDELGGRLEGIVDEWKTFKQKLSE